jgi:RNA polymerase sigma-70 factor (ECF subfamily)
VVLNQTPNPISDYAAETIHHKARQLVGTAGFTEGDIEDIEQELRLDLLERLPRFNPAKATQKTFVARVVERRISTLIRYRTQEGRDHRRLTCSLSENIVDADGELTERASTISHDAADIRMHRRTRSREEESQLRDDVSIVLTRLPRGQRMIAEQLKTEPFIRAAKSLGRARPSLYDARKKMQVVFEEAGLRNYL